MPGADEGRGKLRKASVSCKQAYNRRYPNEKLVVVNPATSQAEISKFVRVSRGIETS